MEGQPETPPSPTEASSQTVEDRKWYKNTKAIVALVASVIGIATGLLILGEKACKRTRPKVQQNVEIVLDSSLAMSAHFEGGTKGAAAVRAISAYLHGELTKAVADQDNLALRVFGGPCNGANTAVKVDFDQGNTGQIENTASNLNPTGESTLVNAIVQATGDFNDERFVGVSKRILVITGSTDSCQKGSSASIIKTRLDDLNKQRGEKIELDFRFIGLGLPPEEKAQLSAIAEATGGQADFAGTAKELDRALTRFLVVDPVVNDINSMTNILDDVTQHKNAALDAIDHHDLPTAEARLTEARESLKRTDLQFKDLDKRQKAGQFQKLFRQLYQLAKTNRETQAQMLDFIAEMITRQGDVEAVDKATVSHNQLVEQYNNNVNLMNDLIGQLNAQLNEHDS